MKIPVVMKTWAGSSPHDFAYISRSIPSLLSSDLPSNVELIIYDDGSQDHRLKTFLKELANKDSRVRLIFNDTNKGPNWAQEDVFSIVTTEYVNTPFFLNVDDDVIYHRLWLEELIVTYKQFSDIGMTGVFTALNMPFRRPHSIICANRRRYLLKWKQPALNWLIPRRVYEDVGPFKDEGIAYDTIYSHWMRLKHYSIVCLTPSYVQNIGLVGAYARGDMTTARDFLGEYNGYNPIKRFMNSLCYTINRIPSRLYKLTDSAAERIEPIRWGTEFVYEGVNRMGQCVAMFSVDDALKLGWTREGIEQRVRQIQNAQPSGPTAVLALRKSLRNKPTWIECKWKFMPNLRECKKLKLTPRPIDPKRLFRGIITQLMPLHAKGIAHNKVRIDNIYADPTADEYYLSWYGIEPCPGRKLLKSHEDAIQTFGSALSGWARPETRELAATAYLETVAPEVLEGGYPTPSSDIFSAAAIVLLVCGDEVATISDLQTRRRQWKRGELPPVLSGMDNNVISLLRKCIEFDPGHRFRTAIEVNRAMGL